jgi:hypothetical protein
MRDVPRNRHLDTTVDAAGEAVGTVRPRESERRRPIEPRGSTRSLAPGHGGQRPILEATRQAAALARRHAERERDEPAEPTLPSERNAHAAEPSAVTRALVAGTRNTSIGPICPDPYTLGRT